MDKFIVFQISGGIGKNIAATAVVKSLSKHYPDRKIIVVTAWPDIWLSNPFVWRTYRLGAVSWFYQDFIKNKDTLVFSQEPYMTTSHITKQKHLVESWCQLCGIEYGGENPQIYPNLRERETFPKFEINPSKPTLLFQPFGGMRTNDQQFPYSWARDIHPTVCQHLVDSLKDKYNIIHVCYDHHPVLNGVIRFDKIIPKMQLFSLLPRVEKRLLIDSSLQHAAAAMMLPSNVVWVTTDYNIFGYNIHDNFTPPLKIDNGTADSYLFDYSFDGKPYECPYTNLNEMFDVEGILASLE